ncbi:hypothetical protein [Pelagibius sp. 7325]|uniref:hypothetical protein n=1 Tax=Pelagibius sp. 7325 TaxID=3131994 RepID=UPI0030EE9A6C
MKKSPHKAVILLGFDTPDRTDSAILPYSDSAAVRSAVKEALAAGLKELIFVTADSVTPVETQVGGLGVGSFGVDGFGNARPERVVIARQFAARSLGQALCEIRHLLFEEPFVVLLPGEMRAGGEGTTASMLAAYAANGGNLAAVEDNGVLGREGRFAAISRAAAGRYLLQPAVLDVLEEDPEGGIAGALLLLAEAWPVTAVKAKAGDWARRPEGGDRATPLVPSSEAPTVRARRPVAVAAELGVSGLGAGE